MDRRDFIKTAGIGGLGLAAGASLSGMEAGKSTGGGRKNMIWLMGDQHRAQALGYMGDPNARTPFLNDLSLNSVTFSNAISGCPWCTPFRGSLYTSRYNNKCVYRTPQHLDPKLPTVTDVFNSHGYQTAFFGKWHLSGSNKRVFVPKEDRGRFDTWIGYENNNAQYDCWVHGHDIWGRDDKVTDTEKLETYETDALTDKLLDFLKRRPQDRPLFAVLSVQPPHNPYVAPPEYARHFKADGIRLRPNVPNSAKRREKHQKDLAGYYAQIENLDFNVGRILAALEELGIEDDTHLAFFSDHGDCHGSHGYVRKSSPWEEAVRIPCIFRPAGEAAKQRFSDAAFNHVDFAPTSLGLCGIDVPEWMDGTDFSHHIVSSRQAPDNEPDSAFMQHIYRKRFDCLNRPWRGIRTRDGWKYVILEGQPIMLFDLNEDPYEMTNLIYLDTYNEKREEMHHRLAEWLNKTEDPFPMPEL